MSGTGELAITPTITEKKIANESFFL